MKFALLKIVTLVLLISVSSDTLFSVWSINEDAVELIENGEKENSKEGKSEKEENKDKITYHISHAISENELLSYSQKITEYNTSACLALPEIPPEQA